MSLLELLALGFFLGIRHATDADHLVAISTIVARVRSLGAASLVGALWGLGHTVTILLVGGAIVLFHVVLPARLGLSLELGVAVMLVALGILNFAGLHEGHPVFGHHHAHVRGLGPQQEALPSPTLSHGPQWPELRPLLVGGVHGLAGSAAVALLVLTTVTDHGRAMACIAVFGLGTVVGMMIMTSLFALPLRFAVRRSASFGRHVRWLAGAVSVVFGAILFCKIGFGDGLFSDAPHWVPR